MQNQNWKSCSTQVTVSGGIHMELQPCKKSDASGLCRSSNIIDVAANQCGVSGD